MKKKAAMTSWDNDFCMDYIKIISILAEEVMTFSFAI